MIPIEKFTLQEHEGPYEDRPLRSAWYFCNRRTGLKVSGYVIEKQFELPSYFLLLINWNCPYEEGCEVVVLSKELRVVGSYSFTPYYNSYLLSDISELSNNHYKLVFNESEYFYLTISYPKKHLLSKVVRVSRKTE